MRILFILLFIAIVVIGALLIQRIFFQPLHDCCPRKQGCNRFDGHTRGACLREKLVTHSTDQVAVEGMSFWWERAKAKKGKARRDALKQYRMDFERARVAPQCTDNRIVMRCGVCGMPMMEGQACPRADCQEKIRSTP